MFENSYNPDASSNVRPNGHAKIKVIGVGGAGNNAVNRMIEAGITSAEYIAVNTDAQILACSKAETRIQIGAQRTKGLGAGAMPEVGREAAEESKEELTQAIEDTDLLFITAGMGGGTGTGAAPVIAKIAKDKRILTVAVVTEPFEFEGRHRRENATRGIEQLKKNVDTIILIPNEKITEIVPKTTSIADSFRIADDVLRQGIRGIADLIVTPSLINLDFADVRTVLKDKGLAHMGVGVAKGENRIVTAVRLAVNSPLLETTIEGATAVLINITGGKDLTLDEAKTAVTLIQSVVDYSANIIFGTCIDEGIQDEVEVTVIATGFPSKEEHVQGAFADAALRRDQPIANPSASQVDALGRPITQRTVQQTPVQPVQPVRPIEDQTAPPPPKEEQGPSAPPPQGSRSAAPSEADTPEKPEGGRGRMPLFVQRLIGKRN